MLPERPRAEIAFDQWIAAFRNKALARGVTDDMYTRVMEGLHPDTTGLEAIHDGRRWPHRQCDHTRRCKTSSTRPESRPPMAIREWDFSPGCARAHDPVGCRLEASV